MRRDYYSPSTGSFDRPDGWAVLLRVLAGQGRKRLAASAGQVWLELRAHPQHAVSADSSTSIRGRPSRRPDIEAGWLGPDRSPAIWQDHEV
jgi:hypothetical protein